MKKRKKKKAHIIIWQQPEATQMPKIKRKENVLSSNEPVIGKSGSFDVQT